MWGAWFLLENRPDNKTDFLWHWIHGRSLNPACFIPAEQVHKLENLWGVQKQEKLKLKMFSSFSVGGASQGLVLGVVRINMFTLKKVFYCDKTETFKVHEKHVSPPEILHNYPN